MARFKLSVLFFLCFAILAGNTYLRFDHISRPLHLLQSVIDSALTSWLGNEITAVFLMFLGAAVVLLTSRKSHESNAELVLNSTRSALRGEIYKPAPSQSAAPGKSKFGKRA